MVLTVKVPLFIMLQLLATVNAQYQVPSQFKPDMTFGDHNDRFDVSSIIQYNNQFLKDNYDARRSNRANTRRKGKWIVVEEKGPQEVLESIKKTIANELDEIGMLANGLRRSGNQDKVVYPVDQEKADDTNFEMSVDELGARRSLDDVYIKVGGRRSGKDSDLVNGKKETNLDYAVPVEMIVDGYLVLPDVA